MKIFQIQMTGRNTNENKMIEAFAANILSFGRHKLEPSPDVWLAERVASLEVLPYPIYNQHRKKKEKKKKKSQL